MPKLRCGPRGQVAAFLMADDHERAALVCRQAADNGGIIAKTAVAVQLDEAGEHMFDVVQRVGTLGMPGQLDLVPDGLVQVTAVSQLLETLADLCYLIFKMNAGEGWQTL